MQFQKTALLLMMLFMLSFFVPHVSAQIPEVPPPTIDREGTERDWDISHPGWREKRAEAARQKEEAKKQRDADAQRKKEERRQLRLKKAQDAANKKAAAKKRKQQADAESQRKKEAKKLEQKRKAAMKAEKRQKDRERKAHALDMMKRFQKATVDADLTPASTHWGELMVRQNDLFMGILNQDAISPEEKRKHRLNLPISKEQTVHTVLMSKVPPLQGGFGENYYNSDESSSSDVSFDIPGLENVSRLSAEITDLLQSEAISELKDFIIASVQNPRAAIALKGGKVYADFTADVTANTLKEIDNFLAVQQGLSQDFVMQRKDQP